MRILSAIFLLLTSRLFAQDVHVYEWEQVRMADPDTVYGISFAKMKLTALPEELARFTHTEVLILHKNKLTKLPDYLSEFHRLRILDAGKNNMEFFPLVICRIPGIEELKLNSNGFDHIPECIERLQGLRYLDLYDTPIHVLPESFVNLKKLEKVDLTGVRFSPRFQDNWRGKMPFVQWEFDPPCDCMN